MLQYCLIKSKRISKVEKVMLISIILLFDNSSQHHLSHNFLLITLFR